MNNIIIDGVKIGSDQPPYIVAELSANHNNSLDRALELVRAAHSAGVNAIKLQTYKPDTITIDCDNADFKVSEGLWAGESLYSLYEKAYMPWDWHKPIFELAKELGVTVFSSPFDFTAVDLLESLDAPAYKIASMEMKDYPLIRRVAETKKPMIVSTGCATKGEILEMIEVVRGAGCNDLILLHCVASYPANVSDYNLLTIPAFREEFGELSGLSDHTTSNVTAITAVALGAVFIEKHFTLDRDAGGPDDSFSVTPDEMEALCNDARLAWESKGRVSIGVHSSEKENLKYRRSLYVVENVKVGDVFTDRNIRSIRPGYGLEPKYYDLVLGKVAARDLNFGEPLTQDCIVGGLY